MRIAVVGAGPIGIAAAIAALERGFEVSVFDKHDGGGSPLSWGMTRFFTPLSMNVTSGMTRILGRALPPGDALLSGPEYAESVLAALVDRDPLRGRVMRRHRVIAIGRRGMTRTDYPGHPIRSERPFRMLIDTPGGEINAEADAVIDATGCSTPTSFGSGGLPARGESVVKAIRTLGDLESRIGELRGMRILLVGHGHSAANAIVTLAAEGINVIWAVRTANLRPCAEIANDPLPERQRNPSRQRMRSRQRLPFFITIERRTMVEGLTNTGAGIDVHLTGGRHATVDAVIALTGYKPSTEFIDELALEISPITAGGARLHRAIAKITDCLTVPRVTGEDLASGEPNFWFAGSRAYGRNRNFLLQTGFAQIETILDSLPHD